MKIVLNRRLICNTSNFSRFIRTSVLFQIPSLGLFSTRRNFPRRTKFCFVLFRLVLPESSQTKKNSAPRGKFRLVENSLKTCLTYDAHRPTRRLSHAQIIGKPITVGQCSRYSQVNGCCAAGSLRCTIYTGGGTYISVIFSSKCDLVWFCVKPLLHGTIFNKNSQRNNFYDKG